MSFPIAAFETTILDAVQKWPVVIVEAETGDGKITQVPQYLLKAGYRSLVTQHSVSAARLLATGLAQQLGSPLGSEVDWWHDDGKRGLFSPETKCLFCRSDLQIVGVIMHNKVHRRNVLVLDEAHEWNLNQENLLWFIRSELQAGQDYKLVLMTAALEAKNLSRFFGGAQIISVSGRLYPEPELPSSANANN